MAFSVVDAKMKLCQNLSIFLVLMQLHGLCYCSSPEDKMDTFLERTFEDPDEEYVTLEQLIADLKEMSLEFQDDFDMQRAIMKGASDSSPRWTNKTVPYTLSKDFDTATIGLILAAIDDFNSLTCLNIRPATTEDETYVEFYKGSGCKVVFLRVGNWTNRHRISVGSGCNWKGIILREIGHAIGLYHEHNKPYGDNYVKIVKDIIDNTYGVSNEFLSVKIVHNSGQGFDIVVQVDKLEPSKQQLIGQEESLSFEDLKIINLMYGCNDHCGNITCPEDGYLNKDCECMCPKGENQIGAKPCYGPCENVSCPDGGELTEDCKCLCPNGLGGFMDCVGGSQLLQNIG